MKNQINKKSLDSIRKFGMSLEEFGIVAANAASAFNKNTFDKLKKVKCPKL